MLRVIEPATSLLASVLLLLTCLLTFGDVVGRNLFGQPIPGATELTELALVGITFLIYPRLAFRQQHIVIDLLDFITPLTARRLQQALGGLLGGALFGLIGWRLLTLAERAAGYGDVTAYLRLPLYPVFYFMAALSLITALAFLATVVLAFTAPASAFAPEGHGASEADTPGIE